jgi:hypothetical protein
MKNARISGLRALRATALVALAAMLLLGGCSFFGQKAETNPGAKGSISIKVPRVSPQLSLLARAASGASASRGYMFLDQLEMTIIDPQGQVVSKRPIGSGVTDQGSIAAAETLRVGYGYRISLEGFNTWESSTSPVVAKYDTYFDHLPHASRPPAPQLG